MSNFAASFFAPLTKPARLEKPYLLTCPFCKRLPTMTHTPEGKTRIECKAMGCGAAAYVEAKTDDAAVACWNRRPG
jgi:restriction alleviation protein Lar